MGRPVRWQTTRSRMSVMSVVRSAKSPPAAFRRATTSLAARHIAVAAPTPRASIRACADWSSSGSRARVAVASMIWAASSAEEAALAS